MTSHLLSFSETSQRLVGLVHKMHENIHALENLESALREYHRF